MESKDLRWQPRTRWGDINIAATFFEKKESILLKEMKAEPSTTVWRILLEGAGTVQQLQLNL